MDSSSIVDGGEAMRFIVVTLEVSSSNVAMIRFNSTAAAMFSWHVENLTRRNMTLSCMQKIRRRIHVELEKKKPCVVLQRIGRTMHVELATNIKKHDVVLKKIGKTMHVKKILHSIDALFRTYMYT